MASKRPRGTDGRARASEVLSPNPSSAFTPRVTSGKPQFPHLKIGFITQTRSVLLFGFMRQNQKLNKSRQKGKIILETFQNNN